MKKIDRMLSPNSFCFFSSREEALYSILDESNFVIRVSVDNNNEKEKEFQYVSSYVDRFYSNYLVAASAEDTSLIFLFERNRSVSVMLFRDLFFFFYLYYPKRVGISKSVSLFNKSFNSSILWEHDLEFRNLTHFSDHAKEFISNFWNWMRKLMQHNHFYQLPDTIMWDLDDDSATITWILRDVEVFFDDKTDIVNISVHGIDYIISKNLNTQNVPDVLQSLLKHIIIDE